ncbi:hypothetical protein [Henriciella aquimarina]|uniref:hypothetical protein n=1 Tax=Henriciella aquimarina TaxID=545261 RepID=UPI000A06BE46|nr:hypothetical protein [Henriciella aquimarina]
MPDFTFRRAWGTGTLHVSVDTAQTQITRGRTSHSMRHDAVEVVRWARTSSPQRSDYALILEAGGDKLVINCNTLADPSDQDCFNAAVGAVLAAINRVQPGLRVHAGASPAASWLAFACFAVPAFFGLCFALAMVGEPGAAEFVLLPAVIGGVSGWKAWSARPWQQRESIPVGELAAMFAGPTTA